MIPDQDIQLIGRSSNNFHSLSKQFHKTSIKVYYFNSQRPPLFLPCEFKIIGTRFTPVCTKTNKLQRKSSYGDTLLPYITKIISLISSILKGEIEIVLMRGNIIYENVLIFQAVSTTFFQELHLTIYIYN